MQYWHSQFWSLHIDSLIARLVCLIAPIFVSTLVEIVEIHRGQDGDDKVEVHFLTGRLPLDCECLSASSLLY